MWWSRTRLRDARNVLFDAALEFGNNWRRDVRSLATERLPDLDDGERAALAREVEAARAGVEQWVLGRWAAVGGEWSRSDSVAAREFVRTTYPWMDGRNVSHAVSQCTYYAWHG
jgi:hypothetical protein